MMIPLIVETNELSNINSLQPHGDMHNITTSMVIPSQHHQLGYNMISTGATLSSDETRLINNVDLLITEVKMLTPLQLECVSDGSLPSNV